MYDCTFMQEFVCTLCTFKHFQKIKNKSPQFFLLGRHAGPYCLTLDPATPRANKEYMELYMARQDKTHGINQISLCLRKYYERDAAYLALIDSFIQVSLLLSYRHICTVSTSPAYQTQGNEHLRILVTVSYCLCLPLFSHL